MRLASTRLFARRLARDARGIALIEFAFVLPVLALLFVGGLQLMDAISVYRKVGRTVRTLADLTTQNTTITTAGADEILAASRQVMAPYSATSAVLRITEVQVSSAMQGTVKWSRASSNGTPYTTGATITMPYYITDATNYGAYFIFSEITYTYSPAFGTTFVGAIPLSQNIYMSPRNSSFIACSNCS